MFFFNFTRHWLLPMFPERVLAEIDQTAHGRRLTVVKKNKLFYCYLIGLVRSVSFS